MEMIASGQNEQCIKIASNKQPVMYVLLFPCRNQISRLEVRKMLGNTDVKRMMTMMLSQLFLNVCFRPFSCS